MVEQRKLRGPQPAEAEVLHDDEVVEGLRVDELLAQEDAVALHDLEEAEVHEHVPQGAVDGGHHGAGEEEPRVRVAEGAGVATCGRERARFG